MNWDPVRKFSDVWLRQINLVDGLSDPTLGYGLNATDLQIRSRPSLLSSTVPLALHFICIGIGLLNSSVLGLSHSFLVFSELFNEACVRDYEPASFNMFEGLADGPPLRPHQVRYHYSRASTHPSGAMHKDSAVLPRLSDEFIRAFKMHQQVFSLDVGHLHLLVIELAGEAVRDIVCNVQNVCDLFVRKEEL